MPGPRRDGGFCFTDAHTDSLPHRAGFSKASPSAVIAVVGFSSQTTSQGATDRPYLMHDMITILVQYST